MENYSCENCKKLFSQKEHLETHKNRKRKCKKDDTIVILVEQKVKKVHTQININDDKIDRKDMEKNYSKKTQKELIVICKEKNIKGYSGKNKDEIINLIKLLEPKPLIAKPAKPVKPVKIVPMKNISPLRYPGGKSRAISILEKYIQTYYPNKTILLSPFFGGGSFELYMKTKGYIIKGNDLFVPLYTFWNIKQMDCAKLIGKIREKMPITKNVFITLRKSIMTEPDVYDKASSYYIINRTSFSGATLCGGFSQQAAEKRLTESAIQRLSDCDVNNITFTNLDCNIFLNRNPQTLQTLIYADPPYYIDTFIYGKDGDMHEKFDHKVFAENILKRTDWIISYNDCDYIRNLYKNCRIFKENWSYGMNLSKKSSEIIILPPLII